MRKKTAHALLHLLVWISVVVPTSVARAQGLLSLYLEDTFSSSDLEDDTGTVTVYVVHNLTPGATGMAYRIDNCNTTLTWLGDTNHQNAIGDSQVGVELEYPCSPGPILLQTVTYWGTSDSPGNGALLARPHPNSTTGDIEGRDCEQNVGTVLGGCICVKCSPQYTCELAIPPWTAPPCGALPVEESSWGRIKSLYR